jgi:predicted ATPase
MLIRLRIKGFKSLGDAEVHFGPFTCIAGANGSGKSNLFDAIQFLRDLTEYSIIEAATRVRDPQGKTGDIRAIFTQKNGKHRNRMFFEADFLIPRSVKDDFNREAIATSTFLNYRLYLKYVEASGNSPERIELGGEALTYVPKSEAKSRMAFPVKQEFFDSIVTNERRGKGFISTETNDDGSTKIRLHQDGGSAGRPVQIPAMGSPKTVLGGINTNDYPTVLAARREMQSWALLQLEPSALRQPDAYSAETHVSANGARLPATLWRLGTQTQVSNRLATLLDDVGSVWVERDDSRRTYTLFVTRRDATRHPARSLSDGTLRFLALAIIAEDPESGRLLCLEEPENGIHPSRIQAILELLKDIAVDTNEEVSDDNPLRQVIINTHSPIVVESLNKDDLIMARLTHSKGSTKTAFEYVEDTWRARINLNRPSVAPGLLLDYLKEEVKIRLEGASPPKAHHKIKDIRTVREYINQLCLDFEENLEQ